MTNVNVKNCIFARPINHYMKNLHLFKNLQLVIIALIVSLPALAQPALEWSKCYGGSKSDWANRVLPAADGGYVFLAQAHSDDGDVSVFHPFVDPNYFYSDIWLVKIDSIGNIIWDRSFGGSEEEVGRDIINTSDGGYMIAGSTRSNDGDISTTLPTSAGGNLLLIKMDGDGLVEWYKVYGGSELDQAYGVVETDYGYAVLGYTKSNDFDVSTQHGDGDAWLLKVDTLGNILWEKTYGYSEADIPYTFAKTPDGGFVIGGNSRSSNANIENNGESDIWIFKVNEAGDVIWQHTFGGSRWEVINQINVDEDGNIYVAAWTNSENGDVVGHHPSDSGVLYHPDFWIFKISPNGNVIWVKDIGGGRSEMPDDIKATNDGGCLIVGRTASTNGAITCQSQEIDIWLVKLDFNGNIEWQQCFGGSDDDRGSSIEILDDYSLIISGSTYSFDGVMSGNNSAADSADVWIAKLGSVGSNVVKGTVYTDVNSNCQLDTNETKLVGRIVEVYPGPRYGTADTLGNYRILVDTGTHWVSLAGYPYWANDCPVSSYYTVNFPGNGLVADSLDLSSYIYNYCANLQLGVGTAIQRRCFDNNVIVASVCNSGTIAADSVVLNMYFPDGVVPVSASTPWAGGTNGIYHFVVGDLLPGECFQVQVTNSVSCDFDFGDMICIHVDATHQSVDCNTVSTFTSNYHCQEVTGSYDPNDKQVASQDYQTNGYVFEEQFFQEDTLGYFIRFQNTGTDTAFTVVIRDTISEWLDPTTLVTEVASHQYRYRLYGIGIAEWTFDNILLPDSFVNEPLSHGFIKYHILPHENLAAGTVVYNNAAIYFDYNEPVITNHTVSTLGTLSVPSQAFNSGIRLYPNPAANEVVIETNVKCKNYSLYDVSGKLVMSGQVNTSRLVLDIEALNKGIYFVHLFDEDHSLYGKVVKE